MVKCDLCNSVLKARGIQLELTLLKDNLKDGDARKTERQALVCQTYCIDCFKELMESILTK